MCCRSEWQERMYIYKWHEVDQTKHEIFCVHIVCNEIQVKVNLEITTFFFNLRFPYCPNFFWFGVVFHISDDSITLNSHKEKANWHQTYRLKANVFNYNTDTFSCKSGYCGNSSAGLCLPRLILETTVNNRWNTAVIGYVTSLIMAVEDTLWSQLNHLYILPYSN